MRFPRAREAGPYPLLDHRPLELAEHAEHLKHRPPGGRRGIDALHMKIKVEPFRVDLAQKCNQLLKAPAETVWSSP
jgi:hypothetical protein